jgi:choline dehydrogenase-like flavoprotein
VRPHSLVTKVIYDEQKQRATGVEIIDTETRQTTVFSARVIFLNASTVATSFILLNSTSSRFPNGLGNGSDQVGRNLMDHHKGLSASAKVDGFEDSYYYGRRPASLYIPCFKNINKKEAGFLRGYQLGAQASRGHSGSNNGIGAEFKDSLTELSGWSIGLWGEGECLPYADNRITLNHGKMDKLGQPTITVDCEFKENEKAMNKDIGETVYEMLEKLGLKDISISNTISFPGNSNHEMGTARMGQDPKTAVLNNFNQMHEVKNVFITDGSCMTSSSCVNPSLTYMALTARACDYAVKEMNKLNI